MNTAEWIARQEGFSETAYRDSAGYWTIGFGRVLTRDKSAPMPTERTTRQREMVDHFIPAVDRFKAKVMEMFPGDVVAGVDCLTALTSFAYNLGVGALHGSRLRRLLMAEPPLSEPVERSVWMLQVALEWVDWHQVTIGGRKQASAGLVDRRRREVALFFGVEL